MKKRTVTLEFRVTPEEENLYKSFLESGESLSFFIRESLNFYVEFRKKIIIEKGKFLRKSVRDSFPGPGKTGSTKRESKFPVEKTGRNEPCPCGSGKKYKKCCLK